MAERAIRVWDLPVRLCHWAMALCLPALWWTAENGEMGWHMRVGLLLLFVLVFRILWGFLGTRTARFASFVKGPVAVWRFVSAKAPHDQIGHSPLSALSVLALLGILSTQVTFGLFAGDLFDGATGPLNDTVGVMTADWMTDWHKLLFDYILAFAALHIAAIAFYWLVRRNNLITPMITGERAKAPFSGIANDDTPRARLAICLAIAGGVTLWVQLGAPWV